MMQKFALSLLVVSVSLLGTVVPVEATRLVKRETNADHFARSLPLLAPLKRSHGDNAKRSQVSQRISQDNIGVLEVKFVNGTTVGYVFNNQFGPTGLNLVSNPSPTDPDIIATFTGGNLLAQDPKFSPPYIGGDGTGLLSPQYTNSIDFTNVEPGPDAQIWTFNPTSRLLNATWTNSDGTKVQPTLLYDGVLNALFFTANPTGLIGQIFEGDVFMFPVTISLTQ
ncbi:hypothetical protein EI94DRAFT_1747999 [Lactarius quietus]|nr:hypothetical protein EI94DRAFT_1747999 [Lactarius quietus]